MEIELDDKDNLVIQSIAIGILLLELKAHNFIESKYFLENYNFEYKNILKNMTLDSQGTVIILMYIFFVIPKEVYSNKLQYELIHNFVETKINDKIYILDKNDYDDKDYVGHIRNAVSHSNFIFEPQKSLTLFDTNQYNNRTPQKIKEFSLTIPLTEINLLIGKIYEILIIFYKNRK